MDNIIFSNKYIKVNKMQISRSKFKPNFSKTSQCFTKNQSKNEKEGLFACSKQKQFFVEHLRKGALFRLSQHVKPEKKITSKDPYLNWLQENSLNSPQLISSDGIKDETQFNTSLEVFQKQKNCEKFSFPKINHLNPSQNSIFRQLRKNKRQNQQYKIKERTSQSVNIHFVSKPIQKVKSHQNRKNKIYLNSQEQFHICLGDRNLCFENKLSKTKIFQKHEESSFNQRKSNMIKSHFYLNEHIKLQCSQTFYVKIQNKAQRKIDFERREGSQGSSVKPFEENLRKLDKRTNLSCYDEVSECFSSMRNQMTALIGQLNQKNRYQDEQKQNLRIINASKDIKGLRNSTINRIITQNDERNDQIHSENVGYLPKFLMKSLILSKKQEEIVNRNKNIPQKLRI